MAENNKFDRNEYFILEVCRKFMMFGIMQNCFTWDNFKVLQSSESVAMSRCSQNAVFENLKRID